MREGSNEGYGFELGGSFLCLFLYCIALLAVDIWGFTFLYRVRRYSSLKGSRHNVLLESILL